MELKTKYKYIHFESNGIDDNGHPNYICWNNKNYDSLGVVEYGAWKRYIFAPDMNTEFSVDCLQDIIHFIGQLK